MIRDTCAEDEPAVRQVHETAFGPGEGEIIADLTISLLHDPTATPCLSLIACADSPPIGHVLFTSVRIAGGSPSPAASILAPLAVLPDHQRRGTGGELVRRGLSALAESGCELVFVLGYPDYYSRFGFAPAGRLGLEAPYPIEEKNADAWMVLALGQGGTTTVTGTVHCADALSRPGYWVE